MRHPCARRLPLEIDGMFNWSIWSLVLAGCSAGRWSLDPRGYTVSDFVPIPPASLLPPFEHLGTQFMCSSVYCLPSSAPIPPQTTDGFLSSCLLYAALSVILVSRVLVLFVCLDPGRAYHFYIESPQILYEYFLITPTRILVPSACRSVFFLPMTVICTYYCVSP